MSTTTIPNTSNHVGCLYVSPIIFLLLEAINQIPKVIGRISPLNAPANTRSVAGFPRISMINVETVMNAMITLFSFLAIAGWNVLRNDTDV